MLGNTITTFQLYKQLCTFSSCYDCVDRKDQALVVVNLGRILINSKSRSGNEINVRKMHQQGTTESEIMKEMMSRSYDWFVIELRDAQVCCSLLSTIHHYSLSNHCRIIDYPIINIIKR